MEELARGESRPEKSVQLKAIKSVLNVSDYGRHVTLRLVMISTSIQKKSKPNISVF